MYEINLSTLMLIGINENSTKIITYDEDFIIDISSKDIINNSCKFFGSNLTDRIKGNRLVQKSDDNSNEECHR